MLKFIKNNKWWVAIISVFAIFLSSFGIFAKSYVDSNKQKIVNKVQNYVQASSYAVQSRILKETENLNEDYINQKIGKKSLLDEFSNDFIWRPNNTKTTSTDTISDLWNTYFGSSTNVLDKNLQIQYKNNNEYKNIENSKGEITPQNIDFLFSISKSLEKFLNGFAPSLASLGLSFIQNTVLNNRDDPNFTNYKNGLNKFADVIENNKDLFSYLGKILTPKQLEKDHYNNLTVQQALIKNINQIAAIISNKKEFSKEVEADKIPEALDYVLTDLGLDSLSEILSDLATSQLDLKNLDKLLEKIKFIFDLDNIKQLKQKAVQLIDKTMPYLATYLYSEIFFGLYYTVHEEIKDPSVLLNQKLDNNHFLALTKNKLDLNILINGVLKVLKNKNSFNRFYDFIFRRFDKNKIFNNSNSILSNIGTGNLIFDLINWIESKLNTISNSLDILVKFIEHSLSDESLKKTIEQKIINIVKTKVNELGKPLGEWDVKVKNNTLEISAGWQWWRLASITAKIELFGENGILKTILNTIKNVQISLNSLSTNISKYWKEIFFLSNDINLDLSIIVKNISEVINSFKNILENKNLISVKVFGPASVVLLNIEKVYDILEMPYTSSPLKWILQTFAKDKINPLLNKIKSVNQTLVKNKFIQKEEEIKEEFSKYLNNLQEHLKIYNSSTELKFNLSQSLYNGNVILDFVYKWINFLLQKTEDNNNPLLPIIRLVIKNQNLENLKAIKEKWNSKIQSFAKKIQDFENISKIRDLKITLPELLLKQFKIESLNNKTVVQLLEILAKYFNDYLAKYPNRSIGLNISSIGKILTALTTKVGVEYKKELEKYDFMYNKLSDQDNRKTILKALAYGFDTHDNSSDVSKDALKHRPKESYYNWDKIHFYTNGSNIAYTVNRANLKNDLSYSPLHILFGINPDKTSYIKDSLGYVLGTLFGGLSSSDPNYELSIENKKDAVSILNVFNFVLDKKDKELKKQEDQIATKYYDKNAWSTKVLNSSEKEINYQLIRLKTSNTTRSKQLGTKFEVKLLKNKNNSYWSINRIIALDYKTA
ncbi:STREFT protein [Mycoplasma mycoides]|uniref:STREFT protein n=1 Tax=Mycoplasma mycoides TaxID=2102 RepID=UPI002736BF71|nr:STREFT protein [Mycoplasma mycoides]MDP4040661.1 STREFT protein [Mycoplasma mycoides]MDP4041484.1 STREFT protein [Mycoplasma mycoides]MDP4042422.1 STREFT protein [Mycoplasma mycoides]MDP4043868.1 STREFT protein [Mycoplasma mycoides]MDP4044769.1 STREFT protein [Mycoplasma mycoides]